MPDDESTSVSASIRRQVLFALGRPESLLRVGVYPLWEGHFRVNVLIGPDAATATVSDSFFVRVDDSGAVVRSIPAILQKY